MRHHQGLNKCVTTRTSATNLASCGIVMDQSDAWIVGASLLRESGAPWCDSWTQQLVGYGCSLFLVLLFLKEQPGEKFHHI